VGELDGETYEQRLKRVQDYLLKFPRAPFTLQRMAELLFEPKRYYNSTGKFFLAFSKLVCGISARNFDPETNGVSVTTGSLLEDGLAAGDGFLDGKKNVLTGSIGFGFSTPFTPPTGGLSGADFFVETKFPGAPIGGTGLTPALSNSSSSSSSSSSNGSVSGSIGESSLKRQKLDNDSKVDSVSTSDSSSSSGSSSDKDQPMTATNGPVQISDSSSTSTPTPMET